MGINVLTSAGSFEVNPGETPETVEVSSSTRMVLRKLLGVDQVILQPGEEDTGRDYVAKLPREVMGSLIMDLVEGGTANGPR